MTRYECSTCDHLFGGQGYTQGRTPSRCPKCGSRDVEFFRPLKDMQFVSEETPRANWQTRRRLKKAGYMGEPPPLEAGQVLPTAKKTRSVRNVRVKGIRRDEFEVLRKSRRQKYHHGHFVEDDLDE